MWQNPSGGWCALVIPGEGDAAICAAYEYGPKRSLPDLLWHIVTDFPEWWPYERATAGLSRERP